MKATSFRIAVFCTYFLIVIVCAWFVLAHCETTVQCDSYHAGRGPERVIDGDRNTFWHTEWEGEPDPPHPHFLVFTFPASQTIISLHYVPRQGSSQNGTIQNYEIYVSDTTTDWGSPVSSGVMGKEKTVTFEATGKHLKLIALSEINGKAWASAAEIELEFQGDWVARDYLTYCGSTGKPLKCAWDRNNIGDEFFTCVRFWHVEWDELALQAETHRESLQVYLPRSGHYIMQAKARKFYSDTERTSKMEELVTRQDILNHMTSVNMDSIDLGVEPATLTDNELRSQVVAWGEASELVTSLTDGEMDGEDRAWWVHTWPAPPGPVVIE